MQNMRERNEQYHHAEVTIVALHEKSTGRFYNLYTLVEYCTEDQHESDRITTGDNPYIRKRVNDKYTLFIRREFIRCDLYQCWDFFDHDGNRKIPGAKNPNDILSDYGEMQPEPDGIEGILYNGESHPRSPLADIFPHFTGSLRVYTKLCQSVKFRELLPPRALAKVGAVVEEILQIPLTKRMEYWGAIFVCFGNLYLRKVDMELGASRRHILVHILPRKGSSIENGTMELTDERPFGTGFHVMEKITSERFVISIPNEPELLRYRIYNEDGELIAESANYFLKKIQFTMAIGGHKRIFDINGAKKEIDVKSYEHFVVGDETVDYREIISEQEKKRSLYLLEAQRTFVYFPGERAGGRGVVEKAKAILQEIIETAKDRCIICDPYFSARDYIDYGIHVTSSSLTLKIITSEAFLIQSISDTDATRQGKLLYDVLSEAVAKIPIECYVLLGRDKSPLHDRFIIIDENVYLLGSSLSEFGKRATTFYRVPDAATLIDAACGWMASNHVTVRLREWMKADKATGQQSDKGNG